MAIEVMGRAEDQPYISPEHSARIEVFRRFAHDQNMSDRPQLQDVYTRAFTAAFDEQLDDPRFLGLFADMLHPDMPTITPENVYRRAQKTIEYLEKEFGDNSEEFPRHHDRPEVWRAAMRRLISDKPEDTNYQSTFLGNMCYPVLSNVSERAILPKLVALLHGKQELSIFDVGCSLNMVLGRLALEQDPDLGFEDIQIVHRRSRRASDYEIDEHATRNVNYLLRSRPLVLRPSVGIDPMMFHRDDRLRERAKSDSLYLGEKTDPHKVNRLELLANTYPSNVSFRDYDAAEFDPSEFGRQFDMACISTAFYQMGTPLIRRILANVEQVVKPDGDIVVQDFIPSLPAEGEVRSYKGWDAFKYNVFVKSLG